VSDLPHVDTIAVEVDAPRERVWEVLRPWAGSVGLPPRLAFLGRVWGADPPTGFVLTDEVPGERVVLSGRHRFARYRLVLVLSGSSPTTLAAQTWAEFPGPLGAAYRLVVVRSGLHALATRGMLRRLAGRCATR
jgi:hypothetical protein